MTWQKTHINLGTIQQDKIKKITFVATENLNDIKHINSSCGCATPIMQNNLIIINYIPNYIPSHLLHVGMYTTKKTITIIYKDDTIDLLSFSATVIK